MTDREGFSPELDRARELLAGGQTAAAEQLMEQSVRRVEQAHGAGSFEAHLARGELGAVRLILGDHAGAVASYRQAVGFEPGADPERRKRLLTLHSELAIALERASRPMEAEQAHLDGLARRAEFYGREHPGYAFGLEPYAAFLARRGEAERALPLAREAAENLDRNQHPRLASVITLLARMHHQHGHPDPFRAMELPDELLDLVGATLGDDLDGWTPSVALGVAESFVRAAHGRLGPQSAGLHAALVAASHAARAAGNHASNRGHLEALLELSRLRGEAREEQHLTLALSLAAEGTGDLLEAERLLRESVRLANDLGDPRVRSHALRQLGVFHAHQRRPEAETVLRTALLEALASDDDQEANLSRVALGVHLQHQGRLDEAGELLAAAVAGLDPATSHAFTARGHLDALRQGSGCGCGRSEQAYQSTLESLVRPELPEGLLEAIALQDGQISVQLAREPTPDEAALLDRVLRQALYRLRQNSDGG